MFHNSHVCFVFVACRIPMVITFLLLLYVQIQIVTMHRNEWVENADRWVAGFLEMFEEGCHKMVSSIVY